MASLLSSGPTSFVSIAATGTHALATASTGEKRRLVALAGHAGAAGATFYLARGAVAVSGTMTLAANGPLCWPLNIAGWCETIEGQGLNIVVSAGAFNGVAVIQTVV